MNDLYNVNNFEEILMVYVLFWFFFQLLASEIRHERNVILQCVRYVVQNNFFLPEKPTEEKTDNTGSNNNNSGKENIKEEDSKDTSDDKVAVSIEKVEDTDNNKVNEEEETMERMRDSEEEVWEGEGVL